MTVFTTSNNRTASKRFNYNRRTTKSPTNLCVNLEFYTQTLKQSPQRHNIRKKELLCYHLINFLIRHTFSPCTK